MPRLDVHPTDYGVFYYAAAATGMRTSDYEWHRINQFIFPFHTMITGGDGVTLRTFVPLDDEWAMLITQRGSLTQKRLRPGRTPRPRRWSPRSASSTAPATRAPTSTPRPTSTTTTCATSRPSAPSMVCGVPPIGNLQDRAMTELMSNEKGEVIYDRSHEHLGTLDTMVINVRKQLLKAVKTLRDTGIAAGQRREPAPQPHPPRDRHPAQGRRLVPPVRGNP